MAGGEDRDREMKQDSTKVRQTQIVKESETDRECVECVVTFMSGP